MGPGGFAIGGVGPAFLGFEGEAGWLVAGIAMVLVVAVLSLLVVISRKKGEVPTESKGPSSSGGEAGKNYEIITERILRTEKKYRSILFASSNADAMPVTTPVNVALQLAGRGRKTLLVDVDLRRDAVAKSFELSELADAPGSGFEAKARETGVENLWVWPAHNFTKLLQMNIGRIVSEAIERYDFVLLNGPRLPESPDRRQIAAAAQGAVIFSESVAQASSLAQLIKAGGCNLIANIQAGRAEAS